MVGNADSSTAGYPLGAVRAEPDDVTAWLARHQHPATAKAEAGWVTVRGLGDDTADVLAELVSDFSATAVVLSVVDGALEAEVIAADGTAEADGQSAADTAVVDSEADVLAAACGRPEATAKVAALLGKAGLTPTERHRRLAELLGLPGPVGAGRPTGQEQREPVRRPEGAGSAGGTTGKGVPVWLVGIVAAAGVLLVLAGVIVAVLSPGPRGFVLAGVCVVSAVGCFLMASYTRKAP